MKKDLYFAAKNKGYCVIIPNGEDVAFPRGVVAVDENQARVIRRSRSFGLDFWETTADGVRLDPVTRKPIPQNKETVSIDMPDGRRLLVERETLVELFDTPEVKEEPVVPTPDVPEEAPDSPVEEAMNGEAIITGDDLKAHIKSLGMSQKDYAAQIGVAIPTLKSNLARGEKGIGAKVRMAIESERTATA